MSHYVFETPGQVELRVQNKAGGVRVTTHAGTATEVEVTGRGSSADELVAATKVDQRCLDGRDRVVVEVPVRSGLLRSLLHTGAEVLVTVRAPRGCSLDLVSAAGDITAEGRFGNAEVKTASGGITVGEVGGDLGLRTASGDVAVGLVEGLADLATASGDVRCRTLGRGGQVKTASGDVEVDSVGGHVTVSTASGDILLGELSGGCRLQSASGDQAVRRLATGPAELKTFTGDLTIAIALGSLVAVEADTLSGEIHSEIALGTEEPGGGCPTVAAGGRVDLNAHTVSGDILIKRAKS